MSGRGSFVRELETGSLIPFSGGQEGYGVCHGTFGELLQGVLPNQRNFMVTFPIHLFSGAIFCLDNTKKHVVVHPPEKRKSSKLAQMILQHYRINFGGTLRISSQIPEGKGLASSSADLVATAYAMRQALSIPIEANLIARLISKIEPTDGVMYAGASAFYHKEVRLKESIDHLPPLYILAIDEGKTIDTLQYNSIKRVYTSIYCRNYEKMLAEITHATKSKNLRGIGHIATKSALMNQKYNYKSSLREVIRICEHARGLGVAVAHSGSFLGILLDPQSSQFSRQRSLCVGKLEELGYPVLEFHSLAAKQTYFDINNLFKSSVNIAC